MRIAIEATIAQNATTGLGNYVINLLKCYKNKYPSNTYYLLHSNSLWSGDNYGTNFIPVSYCHRTIKKKYIKVNTWSKYDAFNMLFGLPCVINNLDVDILHITCTLGAVPKIDIPIISTIHDIHPLFFSEHYNFKENFFFRYFIKKAVSNSNGFLFNSTFTQNEFNKYFKINNDKIETVSYLASNLRCNKKGYYNSNGPIIYLSAIQKRKQQLMFLNAYKIALKRNNKIPDLYFIGPDRGDGNSLCKAILNYNLIHKVKWLRYISNSQLDELMRNASLFVLASDYEGFGIPIIEAIEYGLPIICSNIPVFREIAEDYPIYAECYDTNIWADTIIDFFRKKYKLDHRLKEKILTKFSWSKCSEITINAYKKIIEINRTINQY